MNGKRVKNTHPGDTPEKQEMGHKYFPGKTSGI